MVSFPKEYMGRTSITDYFLKSYQTDSIEIQMRTKYLIRLNLIVSGLMIFGIFTRLMFIRDNWTLIGYCYSLICLSGSLFFISQHKPIHATSLYIHFTLALLVYFPYVLEEYGHSPEVQLIFQLIAMQNTSILLTGLIALKKNQIIYHGAICNFIFIFNYILVTISTHDTTVEIIFYFIIGFALINISVWGSLKIHQTFHFLITQNEKEHQEREIALTQIIDGYIPICANCKRIRITDNEWIQIEQYITNKSKKAEFTHGLCPNCVKIMYKEI